MKTGLIIAVTGVVVLLIGYQLFWGAATSAPEITGKWQAVYYPEGCLDCQEKYIFSPFYETVNECIDWVHAKAETRKGSSDAAECSFDCKKNYDIGGISVCKETVDVLGKPSL